MQLGGREPAAATRRPVPSTRATTSRCCACAAWPRRRCRWPTSPRAGAAAAILGFPLNGPVRRARRRASGRRSAVRSQDAYGRGPVERRMTALRGLVRSGNSGGPVVDGDGRVRDDGLRRDDARAARRLRRAQRDRARRGDSARRPAVRGSSRGPCAALTAGADVTTPRPGDRAPRRYPPAPMGKTLVIAEKPSVGRDLARVLPGPVREARGLPRGPRPRHHLGRRPPRPARRARRVRPQVQEVADGRPADRARRASSSSCATSARRSR